MPFSSAVVYARINQTYINEVVDIWYPDFPYLVGAKISLVRGGISNIDISLEMPYDDFIDVVDTRMPHIFDIGNIISLRFGYSDEGIYTPWYHGLVTEPDISITPGQNVTISLPGNPVNALMKTCTTTSWQNVTAQKVIEEILSKHGFLVSYRDDETKKLFSEHKIKSLEHGNNMDYDVLHNLIEQRGCTYWQGSDVDGHATFFISSLKSENSTKPVRRFAANGNYEPEKSQYPLLSYSAESKVMWQPAISQGIVSHEVDRDTKRIETISFSQNTSSVPSPMPVIMSTVPEKDGKKNIFSGLMASRKQNISKQETPGLQLYCPTNEDKTFTKDKLQATQDRARVLAGISANISTLGNIYVVPGELCELSGLGARFNGVYRVDKVDHNFSAGKWDTTMDVTSEGFTNGLTFGQHATNVIGNQLATEQPESSRDAKGK